MNRSWKLEVILDLELTYNFYEVPHVEVSRKKEYVHCKFVRMIKHLNLCITYHNTWRLEIGVWRLEICP